MENDKPFGKLEFEMLEILQANIHGDRYGKVNGCFETVPKLYTLFSDVAVKFAEWKTKYYLDYNEGKRMILKSDYRYTKFPDTPENYTELVNFYLSDIYGKQ